VLLIDRSLAGIWPWFAVTPSVPVLSQKSAAVAQEALGVIGSPLSVAATVGTMAALKLQPAVAVPRAVYTKSGFIVAVRVCCTPFSCTDGRMISGQSLMAAPSGGVVIVGAVSTVAYRVQLRVRRPACTVSWNGWRTVPPVWGFVVAVNVCDVAVADELDGANVAVFVGVKKATISFGPAGTAASRWNR
jgi:hypothetical protein